jgi:hypothetical protein
MNTLSWCNYFEKHTCDVKSRLVQLLIKKEEDSCISARLSLKYGSLYLYFALFLYQVLQIHGYKIRFKLTILLILQLVPSFCKNRKIWLPSDTTMVSPALLVKHGVSVSRAVQHPGQFVVVFPK